MKSKYIIVLAFIAAFFTSGCSTAQEVISTSANNEVEIDGKNMEWKNLTAIDKEGIAFGFKNDDKNLYLMLLTNDKSKIAKIMRGGLEITLTPKNSKDALTIKYPDKPDREQMMQEFSKQNPNSSGMGEREQFRQNDDNMEKGLLRALILQKELYILNSDGFVVKSLPIDGSTFKAKIGLDKGNFCYELRVPLSENPELYQALKTGLNDKLSIEIATGELENEMPGMRGPGGQGMPQGPPPGGGGMPPGGGHRPGEMRGHPGNRMDMDPLNYSFEITFTK